MPGTRYLPIFDIDKDATEMRVGNCRVRVGNHLVRRRGIKQTFEVGGGFLPTAISQIRQRVATLRQRSLARTERDRRWD